MAGPTFFYVHRANRIILRTVGSPAMAVYAAQSASGGRADEVMKSSFLATQFEFVHLLFVKARKS
jgi:hypothetical protein